MITIFMIYIYFNSSHNKHKKDHIEHRRPEPMPPIDIFIASIFFSNNFLCKGSLPKKYFHNLLLFLND